MPVKDEAKLTHMMIKNVSHKKRWNTGTVQVHAEPHPIPLIKIKNGDKSDKDFVKIKFCKDPT